MLPDVIGFDPSQELQPVEHDPEIDPPITGFEFPVLMLHVLPSDVIPEDTIPNNVAGPPPAVAAYVPENESLSFPVPGAVSMPRPVSDAGALVVYVPSDRKAVPLPVKSKFRRAVWVIGITMGRLCAFVLPGAVTTASTVCGVGGGAIDACSTACNSFELKGRSSGGCPGTMTATIPVVTSIEPSGVVTSTEPSVT